MDTDFYFQILSHILIILNLIFSYFLSFFYSFQRLWSRCHRKKKEILRACQCNSLLHWQAHISFVSPTSNPTNLNGILLSFKRHLRWAPHREFIVHWVCPITGGFYYIYFLTIIDVHPGDYTRITDLTWALWTMVSLFRLYIQCLLNMCLLPSPIRVIPKYKHNPPGPQF